MKYMVVVTVYNQCLKIKYQQVAGITHALANITVKYIDWIFDGWFPKTVPYKLYPL